jgi:hypothetical protein
MKIAGKNLQGESRQYEFKLVDTLTGLKLFHNYISLVIEVLPTLTDLIALRRSSDQKEETQKEASIGWSDLGSMLEVLRVLPAVFTWDRVTELSAALLAGGKITIDGVTQDMGADGMGDYAKSDPMELYTALFYAIAANYPKYFAPFLDSSPSTEAGESESPIA